MTFNRLFRFRSTTRSLLTLMLGSCLLGQPAHSQEARIEAFGPYFTQPEAAAPHQARVYAFRSGSALHPAPINLYLNGRYHTSLLRGGFTEFCLAPGKLSLQSVLDDAGQLHTGKTQPGFPLDVLAGRTFFVRIVEGSGRQATVQMLSESQALSELRMSRRQQHTVSRAPEVQACAAAPTPVAVPAPAEAPKTVPKKDYTLAADALFAFGKATLTPAGEEAIETLARQVQREYGRVERILVIGYTDAIGPKNLNQRLSLERAKTVARLLDQYGLHPARGFMTEGRGDANLAKLGCNNKPTQENKACHAPNRRVVISVNGTSK